MGWVELGGGCLAWLFFEGGPGLATAPFRVYICSVGAWPKLGCWSSCPAVAADEGESGWQAFCLMLMKAVAGQEGEGAAFVLHLS